MHDSQPKSSIAKADLRTVLTAAVLILVGLTALLVYLPWLYTSRKNLESVIKDYNLGLMDGASQEVDRTFDGVIATNQLIERLIDQGFVDLYKKSDLATLYINLLKANPKYKWISFGFPNGDLLTVERQTPENFKVVETTWGDQLGQPQLTSQQLSDRQAIAKTYENSTDGWVKNIPGATRLEEGYRYIQPDQTLVKAITNKTETYYFSPIRPWYMAAVNQVGTYAWSDVYPFFTSKELGIDASVALVKDGDRLGVISISFILDQISKNLKTRFADQFTDQHGGGVFIFDSTGELVASTGSESLVSESSSTTDPVLLKISESTNPSIRIASTVLSENNISYNQIQNLINFDYKDTQSNQIYHVFFRPSSYHGWTIATVVPESMFTENIDRNQMILLGVISSLMLAAAAAALVLTREAILKPMKSITQAAESVQNGHYGDVDLREVASRGDELGQLATVFQYMANEVSKREEKLQQQVKSLTIEIDQKKRKRQVREIVETDFFQDLTTKAEILKTLSKDRNSPSKSEPEASSG